MGVLGVRLGAWLEEGSQEVACPSSVGETEPCHWGLGVGGVETLVASPVGSATLALGRAMWTVLIPLSMFSMGPSRMATGAKRGQNSLGCLCFYSLSGQS